MITVDPVKVTCWLISAYDLQWLNKTTANNLISVKYKYKEVIKLLF